jgi:branched-chain amino acid transport system ATP-binding protein
MGVVRTFQLPQEFGSMTVLENVMVAFPGQQGVGLLSSLFRVRHWRRVEGLTQARALEILGLCGLRSMVNEPAGKLSGGQKKLLELARALACEPDLLLLDEPTAGVSPALFDQLVGILKRLRDGGISMLIVTHEMGLVETVGNDVVVMAEGKVLVQGPFDEIAQHTGVQDAYLGRRSAGV